MKKNYFIFMLIASIVCLLNTQWVSAAKVKPQDCKIIFIEEAKKEAPQIEFLKKQGFDVSVMDPGKLTAVTTDVIATLNSADLIIIGRSQPSGDYKGNDAKIWNDSITAPVLLNAQYIATENNKRINWFEVSNASHYNTGPKLAYARVTNPNDTIFSFVNFTDSIPWCHAPHDFLMVPDTATNGTIKAKWLNNNVLIVENEKGTPLYENGPVPVGSRVYFGFGNDNIGFNNFFPLTIQAQQVYFNEICKILGIPMQVVKPVESTKLASKIILIQDQNKETRQHQFLELNGYSVTDFDVNKLSLAGPDTFDMLNNADLIIIGRSNPSGDFKGADAAAWSDSINKPVILNAQYIATEGNKRINWFSASNAYHANDNPKLAYAKVTDPANKIFELVTYTDSIPWCYVPHDFLTVHDTATYGKIAARYLSKDVLIVQNEADSALYKGGPKAKGPRTYFGFGNDNIGYNNFFPLTKQAQQVYLNEIQRLLGYEAKPVNPIDHTSLTDRDTIIVLNSNYRDSVQVQFLKKNNFAVIEMNPGKLSAARQGIIDTLNNADLIIIGRSQPSGDYKGADATAWQAITAPVICNAQYVATEGNKRINWFSASTANHFNDGPLMAYARVTDPYNPIYAFVTYKDSIPWCKAPHDFLDVNDTATNGTVVSRWLDKNVLIVQNEGGVPLYDGGPTPAEARTYFGFGNDNVGFINFFPLTEQAQQVYLNEIQRLLGRGMKKVIAVEPTTIKYPVKVKASPAEGGVVTGEGSYLTDDSVTVTATANASYEFVNWTAGTDTVSESATYKFKMGTATIDLTANFKFTSSIETLSSNSVVTLYPNPAAGSVTISGLEHNSNVIIMNMVGQLINTIENVKAGDQLDIHNLKQGVYILRVETDGKVIDNVRLIKK